MNNFFSLAVFLIAPFFLAKTDNIPSHLAKPNELDKVEIIEKLDQSVWDDSLVFLDQNENPLTLKQISQDQSKVILLHFIYFTCPMICNFSLKGLAESLNKIDLSPQKDGFIVVSVSLDPNDTPKIAKSFAKKYIGDTQRTDFVDQWLFLTPSKKDSTQKLAQKVGFLYKYDPSIKEYLHTTAVTIISPFGNVSRYLYGISYNPFDMKLSILEAKKGHSLSTLQKAVLYCYRYDPDKKSYQFFAFNFIRGGSLLILLTLIVWISRMLFMEVRNAKQ